jgi:hypothetical protein
MVPRLTEATKAVYNLIALIIFHHDTLRPGTITKTTSHEYYYLRLLKIMGDMAECKYARCSAGCEEQ